MSTFEFGFFRLDAYLSTEDVVTSYDRKTTSRSSMRCARYIRISLREVVSLTSPSPGDSSRKGLRILGDAPPASGVTMGFVINATTAPAVIAVAGRCQTCPSMHASDFVQKCRDGAKKPRGRDRTHRQNKDRVSREPSSPVERQQRTPRRHAYGPEKDAAETSAQSSNEQPRPAANARCWWHRNNAVNGRAFVAAPRAIMDRRCPQHKYANGRHHIGTFARVPAAGCRGLPS